MIMAYFMISQLANLHDTTILFYLCSYANKKKKKKNHGEKNCVVCYWATEVVTDLCLGEWY